jgi:hypothetical protein
MEGKKGGTEEGMEEGKERRRCSYIPHRAKASAGSQETPKQGNKYIITKRKTRKEKTSARNEAGGRNLPEWEQGRFLEGMASQQVKPLKA